MALQFSTALRGNQAQAIEDILGASPVLEIRSGAPPATPETADSGTLLATMPLPADAFSQSNGVLTFSGSWTDPDAAAGGTAGHFRLKTNGGAACHVQGTVAQSGGDMDIDNTSIALGQEVTVNAFSITIGNA